MRRRIGLVSFVLMGVMVLAVFAVRRPRPALAPELTLAQMEQEHIARALRASAGHRGNAARMLGISERNLYRKLRELRGIDPASPSVLEPDDLGGRADVASSPGAALAARA